MGFFGFDKSDYAIFGCVDGEVLGHVGARAGNLGRAGLADDDFAVFDFLTTKTLNTEPLTGGVVDIFGGTSSFYV